MTMPVRPPPNNGMQRSADTKLVINFQSGPAPADAGRYAASLVGSNTEQCPT